MYLWFVWLEKSGVLLTMFSKKEKIWIVLNFSPTKGLKQLRRDFIHHFKVKNHKAVPNPDKFIRVISSFTSTGGVGDARINHDKKNISEVKVNLIKDIFTNNPKCSIRQASRDTGICKSTVQRILKNKLKFKPYRSRLVQTLSDEHKFKRKEACEKFLQQELGWPRKIIFSDEKWFSLKPHPNRKKDVYWSPVNPKLQEEVRDQGVSKVMVWVGFVDGKILPITWFDGSVKAETYLDMLKNRVWPAVRGSSTKENYWFQQDGARVHTSYENLSFLKEKFHGRVISDKLDFYWPPKSPDLNPLDYYFWGVAQQEVHAKKPKTLQELKAIVENFATRITKDTLLKVADNFMKRVKLCLDENGGHFEHLLK